MKSLIIVVSIAALLVVSGCAVTPPEDRAEGSTVQIVSGNLTYPAYLAAPVVEGRNPSIVLIHSFRGLEPGYRDMVDRFAGEGYVVIAPEWQTFGQTPGDEIVEQLIRDSITYLQTRPDVDIDRLGLTGFCAGGRYTMLLLPQMEAFRSGVAWYGFPYSGGFANQSMPAEFIEELEVPMLMIHGTHDDPSPIADIYRYATELNASDKYFELKVYQGEPHGFMIEDGNLSQSFVAMDAYREMVMFFDRTLRE